MKKIKIVVFALVFLRGICFGESYFEIKGEIAEGLNISLSISYDSFRNQKLSINENRFSYNNLVTKTFTPIYLLLKNNRTNNTMQFFFFATSGSKINIKIDNLDSISFGKGIQFTGIPFQDEENDFIRNILPKQEEYFRFYTANINIIQSGKFKKHQIDSIRDEISVVKVKFINEVLDFVVLNKHSYFSLYVFKIIILKPTYMLSLGRLKIIDAFNIYDGEIKNTELWLEVNKTISLKKSLEIGKKAPNFFFKTDNNEDFSLYELLTKEKTLLIFTAKYCGGCIKQIPIIKEISNSSVDKLQIIYVSIDRTKEDWFSSLKKNSYPGLQTCDLKYYNDGKSISNLYNVELIPQIFLIDSKSEILYNNIFQNDDDELTLLRRKLSIF